MRVYFLIQQASERYSSFMPKYLMLGGKTVQLCMTYTGTHEHYIPIPSEKVRSDKCCIKKAVYGLSAYVIL
jgi:hypothetical protein